MSSDMKAGIKWNMLYLLRGLMDIVASYREKETSLDVEMISY